MKQRPTTTSTWDKVFGQKPTKAPAPRKKRSSRNTSSMPVKTVSYRRKKNIAQPLVKSGADPEKTILPLFKHQKQTLKLYHDTPIVFDTSDPGTAKTRAALEAWKTRRQKGGGKLLILAPKTLLQPAWGNDIEKFIPNVTYVVAYANNRTAALDAISTADILITNLDATKILIKQPKKWFNQFDTLVIDESTAFKHRTSQRSKAVRKLVKNFPYRSLLTGTPNPKSVTELWHQLLLLDGGHRLGSSFFHFRESVQDFEQIGPLTQHRKWYDKPGAEVAVAGLISDITIRHKFRDCIDIPETFVHSVSYTPSDKLLQRYKELADTAIIELKKTSITAVNAAVLRQKLLQVASGAVYNDDNSYTVLNTERYELVIDLVKERKHSLVFFNWRHQKDELTKLADKADIKFAFIDGSVSIAKRNQLVDDYQAGKYQVLFLHPETGAHGLTLTRASSVIWSSPIDRADWLVQGKHRIVRAGQKKKTEIITVEALYTIEEKVYAVLKDKSERMQNLLEMLE